MRVTASRGVQCSPASSLFSSLKRRNQFFEDRAHAWWLSRPGCRTEPSEFITGTGLRLMSGEVSFSISVPRGVGSGQPLDLVAELEVVEDVLNIG